MNKARAVRPSLLYKVALIFACTSVIGLFIHEFGHGLMAIVLGGEVNSFYIIPGFELYPHFGRWFEGDFGRDIGYITWIPAPYWGAWENPAIRLAGCALTFIVSVISVVGLWVVRPAGWLSDVMTGGALMFVDTLFYTILPEWFGLRHFFTHGGETAEPLEAAVALGAQRTPILIGIVLSSLLIGTAIALYQRHLWLVRDQFAD